MYGLVYILKPKFPNSRETKRNNTIYQIKEIPDLNFLNQARFDLKSINGI